MMVALLALVVVVGVPLVTIGYIALAESLVKLLPGIWQERLRPWLWVGPVFFFLILYLIYPTINTIYLSFFNADSSQYAGLSNFLAIFTTPDLLLVLRNNAYWLVLLTLLTVTIGLLMAVFLDRVSYEAVAKAIIFLPMAISFVAAGVIWKLMYDYQPPGHAQTGTLNAVLTSLGGQPVAWLINPTFNNLALILIGVWMWTGFSLVILSAGLKSIPTEILEAARVDGANEWQVLMRITVPMLGSTIAVVATTMIIYALKAFDIVYVMTNGNFNTDVIANRMYNEMFTYLDFGRASAIAVILLIAIIPVMLININRFRAQESMR
jgi:alpha-glucoside transport system permease protein